MNLNFVDNVIMDLVELIPLCKIMWEACSVICHQIIGAFFKRRKGNHIYSTHSASNSW